MFSVTYETDSKSNMIKYYSFLSFPEKTASANFSSVSYRPNLLSNVEIVDMTDSFWQGLFLIDSIESDSKLLLYHYCKATAEKSECCLDFVCIIRAHGLNFCLISWKQPLLLIFSQLWYILVRNLSSVVQLYNLVTEEN